MFEFHHVALSVSDLEKSASFYLAFGFKEVLHYDHPDHSFAIKHLKNGHAFLELFWFKKNTGLPETSKELSTDLPIIGVKHFAMKVESLENARDYLKENGLLEEEVSFSEGKTGVRYFFVKDPDGVLLEVLEDKRDLR